jgi:hypothetical protein
LGAQNELWNVVINDIKTNARQWVGSADLVIGDTGKVSGTITFPTYTVDPENEVTGTVNGSTVVLQRKLGGPYAGQIQTWTGTYNPQKSAVGGTISGVGGPAKWQASIVVGP